MLDEDGLFVELARLQSDLLVGEMVGARRDDELFEIDTPPAFVGIGDGCRSVTILHICCRIDQGGLDHRR